VEGTQVSRRVYGGNSQTPYFRRGRGKKLSNRLIGNAAAWEEKTSGKEVRNKRKSRELLAPRADTESGPGKLMSKGGEGWPLYTQTRLL